MADDDEIALEPGYVFHPSDDALITLFLRPSIAKIPFEDCLINHADVYSADPAELAGEHRPAPGTHGSSSVWYFFCSPRFTSKRKTSGRRQRAVGGGGGGESVWKSEGGKKAVIGADGRRVGYLQKFSYGVYESPSSGSARTFTRLGWCMTEYGLDDDAIDGADKQVLCKRKTSGRRQRAVGGGGGGESVWKSEGGKKAVIGADGRRVGYLQKFSYGVYESPSSGSARTFTRLGWCMTEYGLDDDAIDGADKQVLCKVYRSPRSVCAEARMAAAAAKSADSPRSGSKRKADDGADHPEARPRQEEAGSEHGEQPELDLDAMLSAPMDDNLGVEFDTATTEQYMRYLMNDEPLPWAPTMEVAGGGDDERSLCGRGDHRAAGCRRNPRRHS
uniref:NAC domain-containing protein n=1 Tax=Oryza meridionalis TaxID=40149 RepID=A0A0E0D912_9ORYZ